MLATLLLLAHVSDHAYAPARPLLEIDIAPTINLHDTKRYKDLEIRVTFPKATKGKTTIQRN